MSEKRFKTKQELLKWCQKNIKYPDYDFNKYDYVKKLKEKQRSK